MSEDELARIRQQRLAQLQAGQGQGESEEKKQQAKEKEAEMRNNFLSVLTQGARARLATIAMAKPDRAKMVEDIIIQHVKMGMIRQKVDEDHLKDLLEKVNNQTKRGPKVSYERRRVFDDDDDDEDED